MQTRSTPVTDAYLAEARARWGRRWNRTIEDREQRKTIFHEMQQEVPCHPDIVFYESMSGAKMMDSPYSIFTYIYNQTLGTHPHKLHVWSLRSKETIPPRYREAPGLETVRRHTPAYMYYLARATHIIGNSTLPEYFVRKPEQSYLNTWHGIGYKTLGRNSHNLLGGSLSVTNMLQATHVISPCPFMSDILLDGFSMANVYSGHFAEAGYPRIDATLNTRPADKLHLLEDLGSSPEQPVVTYAPTWRGDSFDVERLRHDLKNLATLRCTTVFLGHHIMLKHIDLTSLGDVVVPPNHVNTNELLSVTDILITDYSSIFFDFQVTERPIIHYLYDYEEYSSTRGLTLANSELPGTIVADSPSLLQAVDNELRRSRATARDYSEHIARFNPHDQGASSEAVSEWFFHGNASGVVPERELNSRPKILFWGGRLADESEHGAFFDDISDAVKGGDRDVTLFVSRTVRRNPSAMRRIKALGTSVSVVVRDDYTFGMTAAEEEARETEAIHRSVLQQAAYDRIYEREYRRLFGGSRFDDVRLFPNQSYFWTRLAQESFK